MEREWSITAAFIQRSFLMLSRTASNHHHPYKNLRTSRISKPPSSHNKNQPGTKATFKPQYCVVYALSLPLVLISEYGSLVRNQFSILSSFHAKGYRCIDPR